MTIDFSVELKDLDGKTLMDDAQQPLTLKVAAVNALIAPVQEKMSLARKCDLYGLAQRINQGGQVSLSSEEVTLVKERINAVFLSPVLVGAACHILDPPDAEACDH